MAWPIPKYSKNRVNRAGYFLLSAPFTEVDDVYFENLVKAFDVLSNWRSCHGYPINTFQSTLRDRLKLIDKKAIVAQRLKRDTSIILKLQRYNSMKLAQMQDIGGLRAVVKTINQVRTIEHMYRERTFKHELVGDRDYISNPKESGYRSVHLVYRYNNDRHNGAYNGLLIELQIRSKIQHAWATAVETMGTFLHHEFKSSEGPNNWLEFFKLASSAFAHLEGTAPVPGFEKLSQLETFQAVISEANRLRVTQQLAAYTVAADKIYSRKKRRYFHLIILDFANRTINIQSFRRDQLEKANDFYAKIEREIRDKATLQAVLVSAGPIKALRRAFPNYFLDAREFVRLLDRIGDMVNNPIRIKRRKK